jgi:hypothetical protein
MLAHFFVVSMGLGSRFQHHPDAMHPNRLAFPFFPSRRPYQTHLTSASRSLGLVSQSRPNPFLVMATSDIRSKR